MTEYVCTWWTWTGRRTSFDSSGISRCIYVSEDGKTETEKLPVGALFLSDSGPVGPDG